MSQVNTPAAEENGTPSVKTSAKASLEDYFAKIDVGPVPPKSDPPSGDGEADTEGAASDPPVNPFEPSIYSGKAVPVGGGEVLDVPIPVTIADSVVEYEVTTQKYDIGFGVYAERMEEEMVVKETSRIQSHTNPVKGKFLVQTVPCMLVFAFDNSYSWMREKRITYTITVTPPSEDKHKENRRKLATKGLEEVLEDLGRSEAGHAESVQRREELDLEIRALQAKVEEKLGDLEQVVRDEETFERRINLSKLLRDGLECRLEGDFEDEEAGKFKGWW